MSSFDEKILNAVVKIAETETTTPSTTTTNNPFKGKWVSILGDSRSAYEGYIPEGNRKAYPDEDVTDVSKMWWHILLTKLEAKLCVNESDFARKFVSTDTTNVSNAYNKLHRVAGQEYINLDGTKETAAEDINPDIIIIYLGYVDFIQGSIFGELSYATGTEMTTDFCQGFNGLLNEYFTNLYPNAQIYLIDCLTFGTKELFMKNTKGNYCGEYSKAIRELGEMYGVHVLRPTRICLYKWTDESRSEFVTAGTPKAAMMEVIANRCYNEMMADNCLE